jgi:hypothetical protein
MLSIWNRPAALLVVVRSGAESVRVRSSTIASPIGSSVSLTTAPRTPEAGAL